MPHLARMENMQTSPGSKVMLKLDASPALLKIFDFFVPHLYSLYGHILRERILSE